MPRAAIARLVPRAEGAGINVFSQGKVQAF